MNREAETALLLALGLSTGIITLTGTYTRYVKPSLVGWLAAAAILMISLAVAAIVRDLRRKDLQHGDLQHGDLQHGHRSASGWLLVVPVVILAFVVPPALGARAATPQVVTLSARDLRQPFPPLPAGRAPEVSMKDLMKRVALDSAGTLTGRLITLVGFTFHDAGRTDLARIAIFCCAADAQLARVHLDGPAAATAASHPENTWLRVEGQVGYELTTPAATPIPTLTVSSVTPIDPPANTYAY